MKTDSPTLRRQVLGGQLRMLRRQSCLTLEDAAPIINCSISKLSRVESGLRSASIEDITILLGLYRTDPAQRGYVLALARESDELEWLQPKNSAATHGQDTLNAVESQAEQIVCVDPAVLPRLLQANQDRIAEPAASATRPTHGIDDNDPAASAHLQPPTLLVFIEECVLHQLLGSQETFHRQLARLRERATDSHWSIRAVPKEQTVDSGPFTLLRLPDRTPVVVLEHLTHRLFLERPEDIDAYEHALKHLDNNAVGEAETLELISSTAEALDT